MEEPHIVTPQQSEIGVPREPMLPVEPKKPLFRQKRVLIIGAGVFLVSVLLLIIAAIVGRGDSDTTVAIRPTPPPAENITPANPDFNPSPYASDPEVLSIEGGVKVFEQDVLSATARNEQLRIPILDWNVEF